jgi:hypothetical protein
MFQSDYVRRPVELREEDAVTRIFPTTQDGKWLTLKDRAGRGRSRRRQ